MIKVSVFYPKTADARFDLDYYCDSHMSMVREKLGPALRDVAVEGGLSGMEPGSDPTYIAMGHLYFDSVEAFQSAFEAAAEEILADLPNFTNVEPTVQISEVRL